MPMIVSRPRRAAGRRQHGMMLIEALLAILIFSIGILGLVGLQATAVKQSTDARYRAEAAYLAEQLLGTMWTGDRTIATLKANYNSCGSSCAGWQAWFENVKEVLPGVEADTDTKPVVNVDDAGIVTITIYWRAPTDDPSGDPRRYDLEAQIGQ